MSENTVDFTKPEEKKTTRKPRAKANSTPVAGDDGLYTVEKSNGATMKVNEQMLPHLNKHGLTLLADNKK